MTVRSPEPEILNVRGNLIDPAQVIECGAEDDRVRVAFRNGEVISVQMGSQVMADAVVKQILDAAQLARLRTHRTRARVSSQR